MLEICFQASLCNKESYAYSQNIICIFDPNSDPNQPSFRYFLLPFITFYLNGKTFTAQNIWFMKYLK